MPVNFFQNQCRTESNKLKFGLCDGPPSTGDHAHIDEDKSEVWLAIVNNPDGNIVFFYAIDNCVEIFRSDGNMESRCDGILLYREENHLIFVELK